LVLLQPLELALRPQVQVLQQPELQQPALRPQVQVFQQLALQQLALALQRYLMLIL
jgi:hypothetical protein